MARTKVEKNIYFDDKKKLYYIHKYYGRDEKGKTIQKTETAKTKKEARAILIKHLAEVEEGTAIKETDETVGEYLNWYIENISKIGNQPTTTYGYQKMLSKHILPELGRIKLKNLSARQIQEYITRKQGELSPNSIIKHIDFLRKCLEKAVEMGKIRNNPASHITRPSKIRHEVQPYTAEQVMELVKCLNERSRWTYMLLTVAALTGLRRGELMGLRWCDIDFDGGILTVNQTRTMANEEVIKGPKTDRSRRRLALVPDLVELLKKEQERQKELSKYWITPYSDEGFVFVKDDGTPPNVNAISNAITYAVKTNHLPHITLHGLRHTYASLIHAGGATLVEAQHALGHSSPQITAGIYTHIYDRHNDRAMGIAASQLSGLIKQVTEAKEDEKNL